MKAFLLPLQGSPLKHLEVQSTKIISLYLYNVSMAATKLRNSFPSQKEIEKKEKNFIPLSKMQTQAHLFLENFHYH